MPGPVKIAGTDSYGALAMVGAAAISMTGGDTHGPPIEPGGPGQTAGAGTDLFQDPAELSLSVPGSAESIGSEVEHLDVFCKAWQYGKHGGSIKPYRGDCRGDDSGVVVIHTNGWLGSNSLTGFDAARAMWRCAELASEKGVRWKLY